MQDNSLVNQSNMDEYDPFQQRAHNTSRNSLITTPKNLSIDLKKEANLEDESELITLDFNDKENDNEHHQRNKTNQDNKILDESFEDAFNKAQNTVK